MTEKQGDNDKENDELKFLKNNCFVINFSEQKQMNLLGKVAAHNLTALENNAFQRIRGGKKNKIKSALPTP